MKEKKVRENHRKQQGKEKKRQKKITVRKLRAFITLSYGLPSAATGKSPESQSHLFENCLLHLKNIGNNIVAFVF